MINLILAGDLQEVDLKNVSIQDIQIPGLAAPLWKSPRQVGVDLDRYDLPGNRQQMAGQCTPAGTDFKDGIAPPSGGRSDAFQRRFVPEKMLTPFRATLHHFECTRTLRTRPRPDLPAVNWNFCHCSDLGPGLGRYVLLEPNDPCVRELTIEIPWETVANERRRLVSEVAKNTVVPGFRRGKAPQSVLNRHYEPEILESLRKDFAAEHVLKGLRERDLAVAGLPVITDLRFAEGQPLEVDTVFEVFPAFELGEYRNLKVAVANLPDPDEAVQEQLERMRREHASFHNLDPRPIKSGDFALVSLSGTVDGGEQAMKDREVTIHVGAEETLEAYSEALLGKSPGEQADIVVNYEEDHANAQLAGKTLHCRARVIAVQERELPELDDEFAKDVDNDTETFDELREKVREIIINSAKEFIERNARDQLTRKLAEAHPMELPRQYMQDVIASALEKEPRAEALGEDEMAELKNHLELGVRADLVLQRIAAVEHMEITQEEVDAFIRQHAEENKITVGAANFDLASRGQISAWRSNRLRSKALQFVLDEAERTETDEPTATTEE